MRRATLLATLTIVAAAITWACTNDAPTALAPDEGLVLAGNGKGGGGGNSDPVTIDMTGGYEAAAQQVSIVSDNKKRTELGAGFSTTLPNIEYAFAFSDKIDAASCTFDPADMDEEAKQNLRDHLDDGLRSRTFSAVIEKSGAPKTMVSALYDDDSGQRYKIAVADASAAQDPLDHYVITGGTVWTVKDGFGEFLRCPFTGQVGLTVTR